MKLTFKEGSQVYSENMEVLHKTKGLIQCGRHVSQTLLIFNYVMLLSYCEVRGSSHNLLISQSQIGKPIELQEE